uniref:FRIGIDA-like protein n=1 Tax=Ananas comosus var. bracteatus TaxID=296719 RepID=A0A6V7QUV4_ANACO
MAPPSPSTKEEKRKKKKKKKKEKKNQKRRRRRRRRTKREEEEEEEEEERRRRSKGGRRTRRRRKEEEEPKEEEEEEEEEEEPKEEEEEEEEEEPKEEEEEEEEVEEEEAKEGEEPEEEEETRRETTGVPSSSTLVESVNSLCALSGALSEFTRQWRDLQNTLDFILASIDARSKHLDAAPATTDNPLPKAPEPDPDPVLAELHALCEGMRGHALRKFVASRLSELGWLRREVPAALPRARDPAALVFYAMGHFYRESSKAFVRPSKLVDSRRACILLLEFYVLSGCLPASAAVDPAVRKVAVGAALTWRDRLVKEAAVSTLPAPLSKLEKKAHVLRQSPILLGKLPGIIKDLIRQELFVEAVELICAFELKGKFLPMPLLSSFLLRLKQNGEKEQGGQSSISSLKSSGERELAALKSVARCLEEYKLDPSELADFHINERIARLEKDIAEAEQKLQQRSLKRKVGEVAGPSENLKGNAHGRLLPYHRLVLHLN